MVVFVSRLSRRQHDAAVRRLEQILASSDQLLAAPTSTAPTTSAARGSGPRPGNRKRPARRRSDRHRMLVRLGLLGAVVVILLLAFWVTQPRPSHLYPVTQAELTQARQSLAELSVRAPEAQSPYDRSAFGPAWADEDHNGCDTRNDILARELTDIVTKSGTQDCLVLSGTLVDRYTGATITFVRGQDTSAEVQIDHVVALGDSWRKGASEWDDATRQKFANDPKNLLAVDGPSNQEKAALDASGWVPPNRGFRCQFAVIQIRVKAEYGLWVTAPEQRALDKLLNTCTVLG